jgi:2-phospho-L-lactate guanylyltransferase
MAHHSALVPPTGPGTARSARRAGAAPWAVVIPVRAFAQSKAALGGHIGGHHAELAHAFYLDTLRAVRATPGVGLVIVVTADPLAASQARVLGAVTLVERPDDAGAEGAALRGVSALAPEAPVAVVVADLPALRPEELQQTLTAAAGRHRCFVPDRTGRGTTAVTARRARDLRPVLGPGSSARNASGGAHAIALPASAGLRLDVDTPADLAAARTCGLGIYSAAVLGLWATTPRRPHLSGALTTA